MRIIKNNNRHNDYYLDIDSQRLYSAFDYRTLKRFDKNLINQHTIDHNNYCEYVIKDIYGIESSKNKNKQYYMKKLSNLILSF